MRRSAAPSFKADVKRTRFLPNICHETPQNNKENEHSYILKSCINNSHNIQEKASLENQLQISTLIPEPEEIKNDLIRSNDDVLNLLEADVNISSIQPHVEVTKKEISSCNPEDNLNVETSKINVTNQVAEEQSSEAASCLACLEDIKDSLFFNVLYCKRSAKKHKVWEGDGLLVVKNRSAVLKDLTGKVLDRGLGYKLKEIESLEEGSKFFVGGKECEVQYKIPPEDYESAKFCKCKPKHDLVPVKQVTIPKNRFS